MFPVIVPMPWAVGNECARCVSVADGLEKAIDDFAIIVVHEGAKFSTKNKRTRLTIVEVVEENLICVETFGGSEEVIHFRSTN